MEPVGHFLIEDIQDDVPFILQGDQHRLLQLFLALDDFLQVFDYPGTAQFFIHPRKLKMIEQGVDAGIVPEHPGQTEEMIPLFERCVQRIFDAVSLRRDELAQFSYALIA